tara:strand:+ start:10034 stop:10732 length:699 start_codon:yes stop_codon:yes gene_type:complete
MTGKSKRARAVSAVGREIEAALGLGRSADVLTRWMAFRLAEVRAAVEDAPTAAARKAALAEQDALIMALWNQRGTLPEPLGVDRRTGLAARIIQKLVSDPSVWDRPDTPRNTVEALDSLSYHWAYLLSATAVLTYKREAIALGPEDPDMPLTDEEREDRKQWVELSERVLREVRMREGSLHREPALSDDEAVVNLEQDVGNAIAKLRAHLDILEATLLPDVQKNSSKKRVPK